MGDVDDPDLTELSPVSDTPTRSDRAWALDDADDLPTTRMTPGRITAAAVIASVLLVCAAIAAVLIVRPWSDPAPPAPPDASPPSTTSAPQGLLNGLYELRPDWAASTYRDNQRDDGSTVSWKSEGPAVLRFAFSTTCTDAECIATGTQLDADDKPASPGVAVFRLEGGAWRDMTPVKFRNACATSQGVMTESLNTQRLIITPRIDGTLVGSIDITVDSDECGDQGNTASTPLTGSRVGDIPPGIRR